MTVETLAPGVHAIDAPFEDVPLQIYVIEGERLTVIDPGVPQTAEGPLAQGLAELGHRPADVDLVVNTHGHHDHRGGNGVVAAHNPGVVIAAHPADATWISSTEQYLAEEYLRFRPAWEPPTAALDRIRLLCGADLPVTLELSHGDELDLGDGHVLSVEHIPGHTDGSIALLHRAAKVLFTGDAVQARGTPLQCRADFFPHYRHVAEYRRSLDFFAGCGAEIVGTAHTGVCAAHRAAQLIAESRRFADEYTAVFTAAFAEAGSATLADLARATRDHYPRYDDGIPLFNTISGYLAELCAAGVARHDPPDRFVWLG
ncbi:MBL fold metallo-hydrolase [Amycolatopsis rhabdoformis]|uniref:MBL fold metallo-hydrolase n=1 Tax=Amycolatopsis rhabdoformis TaxID=1448059 RepID=A0ABZ1IHG3_9PSEU|nr:MBL fold metallo-hydrolase [Amycolatopsis rhabdoformis]WSE33884.1 MBL fold metallo-hydrolase [Amycolatopsis rhabdoformis]